MTAEEYCNNIEIFRCISDTSLQKDIIEIAKGFAELQTQPLKQEIEKLQKLLYMIEKANDKGE